MIIKKLIKGNVKIMDDTGRAIMTIYNKDVNIDLIGAIGTSICIMQNNKHKITFKVSDVTATKIDPNAQVPFSGTTDQLVDLLLEDFFTNSTS